MARITLQSSVLFGSLKPPRFPATKLLTCDNPKTSRGQQRGYLTAILHLAPATLSGTNLCARHTPECFANCLYFAGRGRLPKAQNARMQRTKMWLEDRATFRTKLLAEIDKLHVWSQHNNYKLVVRLNGTSDVRWENHSIIEHRPHIQYYDYTRIPNRKNLPQNYHLTFSWSGENIADCYAALANGMNVSVPFLKRPDTFMGVPVIDGDENDLRFLDQRGIIIGLRAKGPLRKNITSVFLGDNHPTLLG